MNERIIDIVHDSHLSNSEKWEKTVEMFKEQEHINIPLIEFLGKRFEVPEDEIKETVINLLINKVKKDLKMLSEPYIKRVILSILSIVYNKATKMWKTQQKLKK
ncbi:hypothetical protein [Thermoanaerobacter pentosaceus]|uniref:Uncharacterized protein n=1 Tax=Thermoanaerobacter pentosaceus TaxID=694059 RepID=A0ABT9M2R4_9THEO|nr:hypothetical protein [Thermoanaerobacter pentosaceus]MDP9750396.1 hypothetical protein [Thermoanaerobacter pentosaceus]